MQILTDLINYSRQILKLVGIWFVIILGWLARKNFESKEEFKSVKKSRKIEDKNRSLTRNQLIDKL